MSGALALSERAFPADGRHILRFDQIGTEDLLLVGGKGANLGELVRAGLPVPNGFCVSASAYRHFLESSGLDPLIEIALERDASASDAERLSNNIGSLICAHSLPSELASTLLEAYRQLGRGGAPARVAVRSSATAEDLPGFSFAGQQDTYLGIQGDEPLLDAVRRCWASLWTARAIAYRQTRGFRHQDVYIAVVVQEMFPSEVSGVLFTVDPLSGDRGRILVNASWGLGEAIVSGLVSPDHWILDKTTGAVQEEHLGDKVERIDQKADGSGVAHRKVEHDDRTRRSLSDHQLAELARIGRTIESHYGYPQDVEWGYADGKFAVLQAREVTGVEIDFGEELDRWNRTEVTDDTIVWSKAWADSFQTSPTTPLMYTIQQSFIARSYDDMYKLYGLRSFLKRRMYRWHRTRPYYSTTFEEARLQLMPRVARNDDALSFFPPGDRQRIRELPFKWWKVAYAQLHALAVAPRYSFWWCADTFYKEFPDQVSRYQAAMAIDFKSASFDQLMQSFRVSEECFVDHARSSTPGIMDYCYFLVLALSELLRHWAGDNDQSKFASLLSGLSTRTVQENAEIWRLARLITTSPVLQQIFASDDATHILRQLSKSDEGAAYLAKIRAFIAENGHRGGSERDLSYPRWRHRPELFINALRSIATGGDSSDPELTEARMRERRERTTSEVNTQLKRSRGGLIKAAAFRLILRWTLKYVRMRDDQRYYADYYMAARYDFFYAIGDRLVERGLLDESNHIFFLGLEEIRDLAEGRLSVRDAKRRVQVRHAQHAKYSGVAPPFFIRAGLPLVAEEEANDPNALTGIPASSGRTRGRARVCKTLEDASRIQKGDILVATATDPGWTPVFSIISAVVVETGGPLAHATLVSREYGIPCVTNVSRATERIQDGALITVDGNAGRIFLSPDELLERAGADVPVRAEVNR
jgi:phosphohistidine swiveling domain-containing protein